MKRTKHGLSHYVLSTFDMGQLVPVGHFEVLPGDSVRMSTSALLRLLPLNAPVMHPVVVRIHHWYVPYRVLWDGWEDFITGGPDGEDDAVPPQVDIKDMGAGSLADKFGLPISLGGVTPVNVNRFAFMAYNHIWNENYRDEDLQAEIDPDVSTSLQNICWEKDYFSSARPWTQKGPELTLPVGTSAPVIGTSSPVEVRDAGGGVRQLTVAGGATAVNLTATPVSGGALRWGTTAATSGLIADLSAGTGVSANEFREFFAIQRYQEARAQFGSRFTEYLRYLGVRSSDARLQRPEYLGGGRATIAFSEVLKTGEGDTPDEESPIGEMRGHGISALRTRRFVRFFEEHGIVLTLASIRPRTMYTGGIHRGWTRTTKEAYWQKELEQIGQQAIKNKEIYAAGASPEGTFGYNNRYDEYRHMKSYVTGDFRSTLNDWHFARSFGAQPTLNAAFVECNPSKAPFSVQTEDVIWGMFSHSIQARRLVGNKTIGRIF